MSDRLNAQPWPLYVLLGCSLTLNVVFLFGGGFSGGNTPTTPSPPFASIDSASAVEDKVAAAAASIPAPSDPIVNTANPQANQAEPSAPSGEAAPNALEAGGWMALHGKVEQSLARTFQKLAGEDGDALGSVFARLFVWDLDLRRDLQAGDPVSVVWRRGPAGIPEIAAASLHSQKLGQTLTAYHWKSSGDEYPSFWRLDGTEVPYRLKGGPLAQYEQITSLLKDRPSHKGMDFKAPVGSEVTATRAGTITRVNWNWGANGNCVEIRNDDGVLAKFLHLSESRVAKGARVSVGQVVALTGNTGHSTAPHLHYQLDKGSKVIDPLDYHGTTRRSLTADEVAALQNDVSAVDALLNNSAGQ